MAPKRKAPSATQSQAIGKKTKPSPGKLRSVQDLFAALPASSNPSKKKAQDLIGSSCTAVPQDGCNDTWTEKYAPTSRLQLAVHKKKVEELDIWLKGALEGKGPRCCCISGPPGCGRSTTIRLLAKENGAVVDYWSFPAPTLWSETKHIGASGYTSKMAEFEAFIDRAKLKALPLTQITNAPGPSASQVSSIFPKLGAPGSVQSSQSSQRAAVSTAGVQQSSLLVVSDFPFLHNSDARTRFQECLAALVATTGTPTIVLVTESGSTSTAEPVADGPGMKFCRLEELIVDTVKQAGAPHIAFNPLTERVCIKEVTRLLKDARHSLPEADIRALVQEVHCDLRNTIQALQLRLVGVKRKALGAGSKATKSKAQAGSASRIDMHSRDMSLNFFHALGKILYNKRFNSLGEEVKPGQQPVGTQGGSQGTLAEKGQPLMPAEEVISRSGLGAQVIVSFLFEHYVHMIAPEAIEDAASAAERFSDAISMLGRGADDIGTFGSRWVDPEHATSSPADAIAGAVACRGYMWANQHPAPRKWHALGRPKNGAICRAVVQNHAELAERAALGRSEMEPAQVFAVQVVPYSRIMASSLPGHYAACWLPIKWKKWWNNTVVEEYGGGTINAQSGVVPVSTEKQIVEDPIEDEM